MQTAGKGRNNKKWISCAGNLFMSIVCKHNCLPAKLSELSLVSGVAFTITLEQLLSVKIDSNISISLTWPNDVFLNKKKVAGIIIENICEHNRNFFIVGIGLNIITAPTMLSQSTTSIMETISKVGYRINFNCYDLVNKITENFHYYKEKWKTEGFKAIKPLWLSKALGLNKPIAVSYSNKHKHGIFCGIDDSGALLVKSKYNNVIAY